MEINELKQAYVSGVYETSSLHIREEPFDLKSGGKSHIYLNHNNFLVQSRYLALVADLYARCIAVQLKDYTLGVVDSVMSPVIVGAMSAQHQKNFVVIKSQKLQHGVKNDLFGDPNGEVVLIDDMTSTGGTIIEAAEKVREHGGTVNLAVVSASRDNRAKEKLQDAGISLISLLSFDEILSILESRLTGKERELVQIEKQLRN